MNSISSLRYGAAISDAAKRHGLDPKLLAAVAAQETGGPGANSGRNIVGDGGHGHGLFQIDDRWHAFAKTPAAMDPAKNADYAAGMLGGLLARFGGNVREALSAYNAGSPSATGTTTDWGDGKKVGYADSVLRHLSQIGGADPDSDPALERFSGTMRGLAALASAEPRPGAPAYLQAREAGTRLHAQVRIDQSQTDLLSAALVRTFGDEAESDQLSTGKDTTL